MARERLVQNTIRPDDDNIVQGVARGQSAADFVSNIEGPMAA
jgi:hypothetical protein